MCVPASGARVFIFILKKKKTNLLGKVSFGGKMEVNGSSERETKAKERPHVRISTTLEFSKKKVRKRK